MELNTTDSILAALEDMARSKEPIDPTLWVTAAQKLAALMGDEADKFYEYKQEVAKYKMTLMELQGYTAAKAAVYAEATDAYVNAQKQKSKLDRIAETIRLAKLRGRMAMDEFKAQ